MTFELLPAIDLRGGRVVRLVRGDFARETVYDDDPARAAASFAGASLAVDRGGLDGGATGPTGPTIRLHVVDLDGARQGRTVNVDAVRAILAARGPLPVELAGGLRDEGAVGVALATGADRVVLGTAALADPALVGRLVARHGPQRVAIALDVRDGLAVGAAWGDGATGVPVIEALGRLADAGARTFEVTAIDRDGTFEGPDLPLLERCVTAAVRAGTTIVASAGIATADDIRRVRAAGCGGAIVGRALYEGRLTLEDALAAAG